MPKDTLKKEVIEIFSNQLGWKIQTIRDQVSRFKIKRCPNCTQNAAAHILGLIKGIKVWGKLDQIDKDSLPANISEIVERHKNPEFIKRDKKSSGS